jgi:quercetin dioxygenase-like cupin family protein
MLMRTPVVILLTSLALSTAAVAATLAAGKRLQVVRSGDAPPERGVASRFTGDAHVTSRFRATDGSKISGAVVHFAAGARTAWHTHPHGQTLVVTAGCGWVQQVGSEKQLLRAGDLVWTPPGVKHWHGASSDVAMSHATVIENVDDQEVVWMEKVGAGEFGEGACPSSQESRSSDRAGDGGRRPD